MAQRLDLSALEVFREVARHRSFSRAAAVLGVTPAALSKAMKRFEGQLGIRLISRTSRAVELTAEGARLLDLTSPAMASIEDALSTLADERAGVSGVLKVTVPSAAYCLLIEPHLRRFWDTFPQLAMEFSIEDGLDDVVLGGFDAGIRLGERLSLDMVASPLSMPEKMVLVAAPGYLQGRRPVEDVADLSLHECIQFRLRSTRGLYPWKLTVRDETQTIPTQGRLILDSMPSIVSAALSGCGVAYTFERLVQRSLTAGSLVRVLPGAEYLHPGWFAYFPSRQHVPARLRAFIDFFKAGRVGQDRDPEMTT